MSKRRARYASRRTGGPPVRRRRCPVHFARRLRVETLEPRWLLSLTNASIDESQKNVIGGGLTGLATWADLLDEYDLASQSLPVIGQSLGEALNLGDLLAQGLAQPIADYFAADLDPTTDELVAAIQSLHGTSFDNVVLSVMNVSGGQSTVPGENELVFNLELLADRTVSTNISLGPEGDALGIDFSSQVAAATQLTFDFSFGVDLTSGLSDEEAFFIRVSSFDAEIEANAASLTSGPMSIGFFAATLSSGSMALDAAMSVSVSNPDLDAAGNITLAELQDTSLAALVSFTGSGTASGSVTAALGTLGTFSPSGTPTIGFTSTDPFTAPTLTFNTAYDEVRSFTNISSFSYLGVLEQLAIFLDGLADSELLDASVQLASEYRVGELIDLGEILREGLNEKLHDSQGFPTFGTAQELASELAAVLGLSAGTIDADYDPVSRELTYHLIVSHAFAPTTVPLGIDLDLSPVSGFTSTSQATLQTDGSLEFTLGVDLSDQSAVMTATTAAPANGQISSDANFTLSLGFGGHVPVTLSQAATSDNTNRNDLVLDVTAALAAAGLSGSVIVMLDSNNRLMFATSAAPSGLAALELRAADYDPQGPPSSDPIVTELGFRERHFAFDSLANRAFVEAASISGSVSLASSSIVGTAAVGFLNVDVVNGSGTSQVDLMLDIKDPHTQTVGGRAELFDLLSALATGITDAVDAAMSGPLAITLAIDTTLAGVPLTTSPELVISWPDISTGTPTVTLLDGSEIERFEHLSGSDFANALADVGTYLDSLEGFSFFDLEIPGLSKSFGEMAGFSESFTQFVIAYQNNPAGALDDLEAALESAFGLAPDDLDLSLVENGDVVRIDLTIAEEFVRQFPVAVKFPFINIDGLEVLEMLISFQASGIINVDFEVDFQLSFGIDISNTLSLEPFIYESSHLRVAAEVNAQDIAFQQNIGVFGVFIKNGTLLIDADGNPFTRDQAALDINLTDNNSGTSDGKISLASIGLDNAEASISGQVNVNLPIYFPFQFDFLGDLGVAITDLADIAGTTTFYVPDFSGEEEDDSGPGLVDRLNTILNGLDMWFQIAIDAFNGKVGGVDLPFVGKDLNKVADFLEEVHQEVISQITARFAETEADTGAALQTALFMALGPEGLNILKDRNGSGTVTIDDIEFTSSDLDQDTHIDQVEFFMNLGQDLTVLATPIDFDIGLPGLGLDVDGNLEVLVGYEWDLSFGLSNAHGFYLLTEEEDEITVDFEIRTPDLHGRGELAFLQFDVTDEDADSNPNNDGVDVDMDGRMPSSFTAGIAIDILDPIDIPQDPLDSGKLQDTEIEGLFLGEIDVDDALAIDLVGAAELNLDLLLSYEGDARFPSIGAEFTVDWMFAGSNSGEGLTGGVPTVAFNRVTINAGELISEFADGVLKQVKKFTEPIQPVVDFVTSPIPILSGFGFDFTPLDIARALGYATEADYVEAVADLISVVNSIPEVDDLQIALGSFVIVEPGGEHADLRDENSMVGAMPEITETVDPVMELKMADEEAGDFFDALHEMGIYLPILENPFSVFQLMLGQTVDLFLYDIPPLVLNFPFPIIKIGPLIPPIPLFASISGNIGAALDLAVGFDTHGFEKVRETGDWYDIFAGFFLSDTENPDGTGEDVPEATLYGNLNAAAEISLVVVGAGVSGGVDLELFADLVDTNMDGKIHVDELIANIPLGVTGTFDLGGTLTARLDAFVELLFKRVNLTIAEIEVASFEFTDEDIFRDRFDGNNTMGAAKFLGVGPGLHIDGLSLETTSDVDWFEFELLRPDSIDVDIRHSAVHGDIDLEVYNEAGQKIAEGKSGQDRDVASLVDVPAGNYFVRVSGSNKLNNYELAIEPGSSSSTRVIYVSPPAGFDRGESFYTYAPGNDAFEGLNHRKPKASLQNVLNTYDLGPNDLVVFDTGVHAAGGTITAADSGALFVGSVGGSTLSGITLEDADDNLFYRLEILSASPGLALYASDNNVFALVDFSGADVNVLIDDSHGNFFDRSTFAGSGDGVRILGDGANDATGNVITSSNFKNQQTSVAIHSRAPNLLQDNTFTGSGVLGVHLPPDVPAMLVGNDISGRTTGILWESRVASVFDNDLFSNTVGIETLGGVVGPDNPTPFGAPGGAIPNRVYGNETGILVPETSAGALIRHTEVFNNTVGIEAHGDQTQLLANDIYSNGTGIRSDREIGPANWDADLHNLIHDNETGIAALAGAEVRFNRIFSNDAGVEAFGTASVHHNLIYRNLGDGILVSGARGVDVVNNTIFSPGQSGVHLEGFVADVDIRNNILMTTSGFGLRVEAESQFGYSSDYNNFFSTGGGGVAFQGKSFVDLYDWQVEAESDLHSLGTTVLDPTLDDPLFVDLAADDYHLSAGSTGIDAGDPAFAFNLEPLPNGNRINLGAYGNTPQATTSPDQRLEITAPNFYVDLVPSQIYAIHWETNNIGSGVDLDIDLIEEGVGKIADVATVTASAGTTTWTPGNFVIGDDLKRYRLRLSTLSGPPLVEQSREPFAIPDFDEAADNTFYVNDASTAGDLFTTGVGNNRNTGLTADTPKVVVRPLVLSYSMGPSDTVLVDTGDYVHAVNLNLSSAPLAFDPRMNSVSDTLITGPLLADRVARIDRANPHLGSAAIDMIDAPNMTLARLSIVGAGIGVRAREGSSGLDASRLVLSDHGLDGLSIETASHDATLDLLTVRNNARHGIFVDSRLVSLSNSTVHDNVEIGVALRSIGAASVTRTEVYNNFRGMDVINPGPDVAVIGFDVLPLALGNRVHHNEDDGIYASGNVLVAGNTVNENGNIGIRLDDGADALRNIVRQHVTGISARGSTSDITENRSFLNSVTGIEASYDSNILRNVTYNNELHGIHADRFSGVIDHNLVYSTGYASMNVEGPGVGAQITHNTIYEPCDANDDAPAGVTTVTTDWDPQVFMEQMFPPGIPPFFTPLWGELTVQFGEAVGNLGGVFHLGPGGGAGALLPEPLPPGERWTISYEFTDMEVSSSMFDPIPGIGIVEARLAEGPPSTGQLILENVGGALMGTNHLELWFEFTFPELGTTLLPETPLTIDYVIDPTSGFDEFEVLQVPTFIPALFPPPDGFLFDPNQPSQQWRWEMQLADVTHGDPDPPPQDRGDTCAELGIIVQNQSSRVLLRQNAVFVEGDATIIPGDPNSLDIIVSDDSTFRWDSDFNAWMTDYGAVGMFANVGPVDLLGWQAITSDDFHSIDPDWRDVWVDPDGDDNMLGGLTSGFDDNFHLRSPFGQVDQGALAPVEDLAPGGTGLPFFEVVVFETTLGTVDDLSPLVDAGEPTAPFLLETPENGQFANIGVYGNTVQASRSEPEYIHMVYPIGAEQIVPGQTYELRWRSHDYIPGDTVTIKLRHDGPMGFLETSISPAAPNTGSFSWTVPPFVAADTDYVIVMTRPSVLSPGTDIVGVTPFLFEIGGDTRPPVVLSTTPEVVELAGRTNADISAITVQFSENVFGAASATSYQLKSPGANGVFDDGDMSDDVLHSLVVTYTPGMSDGDTSSALLTIIGGPLAEGDYRLTISSSGIADLSGLSLDGTMTGGASDYVRIFTVDKTSPLASIPRNIPDPNVYGTSPLSIEFDEAVAGLGLADVRLTRNGGPNLLSGTQGFTTADGVTWELADTTSITSLEGTYTFELTAADSLIRDLAGNPLVIDVNTSWVVDTTPPALDIVDISPDPRASGVSQVDFVFSEEVFDFTLADLRLFHNGQKILLGAGNVLSTTDNVTWTISNLSALTSAEGSYLVKVVPGGTLHDLAGNTLQAEIRDTWQVIATPPMADVLDVSPDPRVDPIDEIILSFNVPVSGFDLSDLQLTRDASNVSLTGLSPPESLDGMNWHITGLAGLTSANGSYQFSVIATGSGIQDLAGNPLAADAVDDWVMDSVSPTVFISTVSPDPGNLPVPYIDFTFSKPVTGVDLANLELSRNATPIDWTNAQSVTTSDGITWRLNNLASLTSIDGNYTLTLDPNANLIEAFPGNSLLAGDSETWQFDATRPTVTMSDVMPNAAFDATDSIEIVFTEPVSGFDTDDLVLMRRGIIIPLTGAQTLTTSDSQTWTLTNLAPLTAEPGKYELSLRAVGSAIEDAAHNALSVGTFETWRVLIPGDLSADNRVGLKDLARLGRNIGISTPTPEQGDLDRDLSVGRPDLVYLLGVYGSSISPPPAPGGSSVTAESTVGRASGFADAELASDVLASRSLESKNPISAELTRHAVFSLETNPDTRRGLAGNTWDAPGNRRHYGGPSIELQHDFVLLEYLSERSSPPSKDEPDDRSPIRRREFSTGRAAADEVFASLANDSLDSQRSAIFRWFRQVRTS